ncbi:MAG: hypothetical protein ABUT20_07925 [Bacteroidota bacterium]
MQELIDKIIAQTGISQEKVTQVLNTIKSHIVEKFPALAGTLENMMGNKSTVENAGAAAGEEGFFQKAEHFVEDHAGNVSGKAKDLLSEAENKIKGMFS